MIENIKEYTILQGYEKRHGEIGISRTSSERHRKKETMHSAIVVGVLAMSPNNKWERNITMQKICVWHIKSGIPLSEVKV